MNIAIVVESMFGNTRRIAEAIATGMSTSASASLVDVDGANRSLLATADLLVVGGPTHAHGMSRATTARIAVQEGGSPPDGNLRAWLRELPAGNGKGVAAFDTRFDKPTLLVGSAAHGIARRLEHRGYRLVTPPASFFVESTHGPLCQGELERAVSWGRQLGAALLPA